MPKRIKVKDLKVGMYINLGESWLRHSFLKQKFKITSEKQIEKIIANGIKEVKVDISKSDVIDESSPVKEVEEARDQISSPAEPEIPPSVQKASETAAAILEGIDKEEKEPGPDVVTLEEKESGPEGPVIDTVKIESEDVEWEPGPDVVTLKEKESGPEGPVIDTVKIESGDVEWEPGPDVVTLKEKESGPEGPVIDTVKIEPGSAESGSGIADVGLESKEHDVVEAPPAKDLDPLASLTVDLSKIIEDANASPSMRANAFYSIAKKMMNHTLAHPNADNILHAKTIVGDIAEVILNDDSTANCFTQIVSHNPTCYIHSVNVGVLGLLLAKAVFENSPDHNWRELGVGFFLHDLGWCKLPTYLFNKSKRLTNKEWEMIRMHPLHGKKILHDANQLTEECANIVLQHHERDDGSGFPFGLSGPRIHVYARICSIADIFDTLISKWARHLYKPKKPTFEALQIMKEEMIGDFSQDLFREFVLLFE